MVLCLIIHDIKINNPDFIVEVKARKNGAGFKTLKRWMGAADALIMHEDFEESLVAISLPKFIDLLLNNSNYQKPYELQRKEKQKEYEQSKRSWAAGKRKEIYQKKRRHSKRPNKSYSKKKYRGQGR